MAALSAVKRVGRSQGAEVGIPQRPQSVVLNVHWTAMPLIACVADVAVVVIDRRCGVYEPLHNKREARNSFSAAVLGNSGRTTSRCPKSGKAIRYWCRANSAAVDGLPSRSPFLPRGAP